MLISKHMEEARRDAIAALRSLMSETRSIAKAVLLDDLFGRIHVALWQEKGSDADAVQTSITSRLAVAVGQPFWTGDVQIISEQSGYSNKLFFENVWNIGIPERDFPLLRVADRYRSRGGWLAPLTEPLWPENEGPPIVSFYSFKGGAGRTTSLASFAIARARKGERVVIIDFDLDAPGAGALFAEDSGSYRKPFTSDSGFSEDEIEPPTAHALEPPWGIVDYLLERPLGEVDLREYYRPCRREAVTGPGEVLVFGAGRVDSDYLRKLARVDLEPPEAGSHGLANLVRQSRDELAPHWILIDSRAGLGEPAGLALGGLAHLHVLFGTSAEQSWQGLGVVLDRLGKDRVLMGLPQAACVLVHAMVPVEQAETAHAQFENRADQEFRDRYYAAAQPTVENAVENGNSGAEQAKRDDGILRVDDMGNRDAAHRSIAIHYSPRLAHFRSVDGVADALVSSSDHAALSSRILTRLRREDSNESSDA